MWNPARALQFGHGAEAVENLQCYTASQQGATGFNSATALRPWRTRQSKPPAESQILLQFGHGAEAVENIGVLISGGVAALMLQFGHGAEAVENPEVAVRRLLAGVASIRPRR